MPKQMNSFPKPSGRPTKKEAYRIGRDGPYGAMDNAMKRRKPKSSGSGNSKNKAK